MPSRSRLLIAVATIAVAGLGSSVSGCDAGNDPGGTRLPSDDDTGTGGRGGGGSSGPSVTVGVGGNDATTGGPINPCGSECGPEELCDGIHAGLDDDCDGQVDEGCPCAIGQASPCFKGDPSFIHAPGCAPGTMQCSELGSWGACDGGQHAVGETPCQEGSLEACHAIQAVPFATTNLLTGTGIFSQDADGGSGLFEVACPLDVQPCPAVQNGTEYRALQSGEYTVTYTKTVGGQTDSCTFPLYVGARGLRVELSWNFANSTDFDLHMMQPNHNGAFEADAAGSTTECAWDNCRIDNGFPEWFPASAPEGDPVRWYLDPDPDLNSCYFAPRGVGAQWEAQGQGCHSPRLDLDNVTCSTSISNTDDLEFCAPENINIDFPPTDQWIRLGVVHYSGATNQPTMKIFCDGALKALLGPEGFNAPLSVGGGGLLDQQMWIAADVAFVAGECGNECVVRPVYRDQAGATPWIDDAGTSGPPFPPPPEAP